LNDEDALEHAFHRQGPKIAAVILEPIPANSGLLLQRPEFLQKVRDLTTEHGALLIFDEVISGFRVGATGAAGKYGICPDLITFGKVIGSGMPVGAFGGRRDVMETVAPLGPVYQAGTLSGNPVAMAAGAAGLHAILDDDRFFDRLETLGARLAAGVADIVERRMLPVTFVREGSIFWLAFQRPPAPRAFSEIDAQGATRYAAFHREMLERGIYLAPSAYEVGFLSAAHTTADIDRTVMALEEVLTAVFAHAPSAS
jgi:glutamate-1-semialdehyde 2,1-aminomutase